MITSSIGPLLPLVVGRDSTCGGMTAPVVSPILEGLAAGPSQDPRMGPSLNPMSGAHRTARLCLCLALVLAIPAAAVERPEADVLYQALLGEPQAVDANRLLDS